MGARVPWSSVVATALAAGALVARSCSAPGRRELPSGAEAAAAGAPGGLARAGALASPQVGDRGRTEPGPPSAGWETEAEEVAADLRRILEGRPRAGAYAEARAEAARADLALFPPPRERVRRLLLGSERERIVALAALAARPDLDDDLLRIVLRSQHPEDDDVVRLLGAEIAGGVPAELAARHEEDLLRAFEEEPNPLVLSVAFPALERMDEGRLGSLLRAQAASADPEMLPLLLALARDRLGAGAEEGVRSAIASAPRD